MKTKLPLGLFFCAAAFWQQKAPLDETVVDFKKFYPTFTEPAQKIEAILALEGHDTPDLVELVLPILQETDFEVRAAALRVLSQQKTPESVAALIGGLKAKNPAVRAGAAEALGKGGRKEAIPELKRVMGESAPEPKAAAALAIGKLGDRSANELLIKLLEDAKDPVRVAACDALGMLGDPATADAVLTKLADKDWQVRAASIAALGSLRVNAVIPRLIEVMEKEEGRLVEDAARSLDRLTGADLGPDAQAWRQWWTGVEKGYQVPTEQALKEFKDRQRKAALKYGLGKTVADFNGITTPSKRILFVIDQSGSMEDEILDRKRFEGRGYTDYTKLAIVKAELLRTIKNLDPKVRFNIVTFATGAFPWKKQLVPADVLHKASADAYISRLISIGGASKSGLAGVGLAGAAGLEEGKTNTFLALMTALGGPGGKAIGDVTEEVDTIFFLSDGRPSVGKIVEPQDILAAVREANKLKKVVIHALAIGEFQKDFMEQLAKENGGVFVDLGK